MIMRSMIVKKMSKLVMIVIAAMLLFSVAYLILDCQKDMEEESGLLFREVEAMIDSNGQELNSVVSEYNTLCLSYADAVAYILQQNPSIMDDVDELNKIAAFMQVDEIHIFDGAGTIIKGSVPKYFNMTIYDGEQIGFFAPMFNDKSLRLCQEITPNTSEGAEMQYAAVWNESGEYVVQVGVAPARVFEVMRKNQVSYIFSMIAVDKGTQLYAIEMESGEILGSTNKEAAGKNVSGMHFNRPPDAAEGPFHSDVYGESCYCVAKKIDSMLLVRTIQTKVMYGELRIALMLVAISLCILAGFLIFAIVRYLDHKIVKSIHRINEKLMLITEGRFDEKMDVDATPEFRELGDYIHIMVKSILGFTDRISYVLDSAQLKAGIYEYSTKTSVGVRATKQVGDILCMGGDEETLLSDRRYFEEYLKKALQDPVTEMENSFRLESDTEKYIRMESFTKDNNVMGILVDVTATVLRSRQLERERDMDVLTGFYNRTGLDKRLGHLFGNPEKLGYSAVIMLDADGLKGINDRYGHETGDMYLRKVAETISSVKAPHGIVSRRGGDEFVLFYYGCDSREELSGYIGQLKEGRDCSRFLTDKNAELEIRYSLGYVYTHGGDYQALIREADAKMYEDKNMRKMERNDLC